ncbi:MAG: PAS domain-containing protein [Proteobacteria bacterium]|nr:PAS domain-containing protein [Pseudomonadota bacterium]
MPVKKKSGDTPEKKRKSTPKTSKSPLPSHAAKEPENLKPADNDRFFIVGMGASAGGLDALEKFFQHMPHDSHMAFIVVTHLDPNHVSIMPELIRKQTQMTVLTIADGLKVDPDCIYIVPPNNDVGIIHGFLQLIEFVEGTSHRSPINYFFKTLAADQKEKAIGIILSGMGTDGTLGLKAIKEEQGMAMVHDPETAKFDGMPKSAIETGRADYILPPEKMPDQLIKYIKGTFATTDQAVDLSKKSMGILQKIFITIRSQTGHDFSHYKKNTILRRIERRMNVHQIDSITHYYKYLQQSATEVKILFNDFLIGVTRFFRDSEAFDALSKNGFPKLLENKPGDYTLRMWVPGCSTGEEAYSIGIVLKEFMDRNNLNVNVQIFATDLDPDTIDIARKGLFPASTAEDVGKERLSRYFAKQGDGFQIRTEIREMIVFAAQDIIKDPPFTKLDLISCRNLLIYFDNDLQKMLIPLFHYALNPNGVLFLGTSETIGGFLDLFSVMDKKWKIYERKPGTHAKHAFIQFPVSLPVTQAVSNAPPQIANVSNHQLIERVLLRDIAPPCVLINEKGEILYIHGRTGKYLEPAPGEFQLNILDMARKGLKFKLSAAIRKAVNTQKEIVSAGLTIEGNSHPQMINLIVKPLHESNTQHGQLLIIFEDLKIPVKEDHSEHKLGPDDKTAESIKKVEAELQYAKENLQTTIEELETSNEELKSTNEELQSTNEELQSTNEELKTSKEEQQSLSEELQTVNSELQKKIEAFSQANNDMKNLLDSMEIPTLFLDNRLCIKRFTAPIHKIMNLIPSDIGRPINDMVVKLKDTIIVNLAEKVLKDLAFREKEVITHDGHWYLMRIRPYRTLDNIIDGLVVIFLDIDDQKSAMKKIETLNTENQDARNYSESIIETLRESILVLDHELRIISANKSFYRYFKVSEQETIGKKLYDLGNGQWDIPDLRRLLDEIIPQDTAFDDYKIEHDFKSIGLKKLTLNARKIVANGSKKEKILLAIEAS